jgi:hypothetical protein
MRNLIYIVAAVLIVGWLIGYFGFSAGSLIPALLIIALAASVFNTIGRSRTA